MLLKKVTVQNFRNIPLASLEFAGRRHFLLGSNGQGKTNLLEAIGYVTALRSFRTADYRLLIRRDEREAAIGLTFDHDVMGETPVQIVIRPDGRSVMVDQAKATRLGDILGKFPTVLFSSDDVQFVRASPGFRRRWIDLVLSAADPDYLQILQRYHRALRERNSLLKSQAREPELKSFETAMAPLAAKIFQKRSPEIDRLGAMVSEQYAAISSGREAAELRFRPNVASDAGDDYLGYWTENRNRDLLTGSTQRGPHRDDYVLFLDGQRAGDFASEGQQRALVLALRLAQLEYFRQMLKVMPVLLADDIVNELDPGRRESFWRAVGDDAQLIATGTSPPGGSGWEIFEVENGEFRPVRAGS